MEISNQKPRLHTIAFLSVIFPAFWLLLPNIALILYNPVFGGSLKTLGLLFTIICTLPVLLLISKNLRQFWLWNLPFAAIAGLYAAFISQYHDIPYDGMWFALWTTSASTIGGVTDYFSQDIIIALAGFMGYCLCLLHPIQKRIVISKNIKQRSLLLSVMIVFLCMSTTNFLYKKIAIQRVIDETVVFENYPYGMLMMMVKTKIAVYKKQDITVQPIARTHIPKEREIYVLVIGEAARHDYWYEISKKTQSILLTDPDIKIFNNAVSQANFTSIALPLLLTGTSTIAEANTHPIWPQIAKAAGCITGWITNSTEPYDYAYKNDFYDLNVDRYAMVGLSAVVYDEVLVSEIMRAIQQGPKKLCLVVHLIGSHFDYRTRYRADIAEFKVDQNAYQNAASPGHDVAFRNAYKNSLLETNRVLQHIITLLKKEQGIAFLLYTADHAESFDDNNNHLFFHGNFHPGKLEMEVPFFIWANPLFQKIYPEKWQAITENQTRPVSNLQILPTMMDVLSVKTIPDYLSSSLLRHYDKNVERMILLPQMQLVPFSSLQ